MVDNFPAVEDCQKKAAELGFDLTKQFLTLAFAGIAFIVGLSFNTPGAVSSATLWLVIGTFGASAALGLGFLDAWSEPVKRQEDLRHICIVFEIPCGTSDYCNAGWNGPAHFSIAHTPNE